MTTGHRGAGPGVPCYFDVVLTITWWIDGLATSGRLARWGGPGPCVLARPKSRTSGRSRRCRWCTRARRAQLRAPSSGSVRRRGADRRLAVGVGGWFESGRSARGGSGAIRSPSLRHHPPRATHATRHTLAPPSYDFSSMIFDPSRSLIRLFTAARRSFNS
jgi:hypothetical protein